ncbi:WD40-repeat-containing domain protein [Myxozyma melibiosi]|uniref:WD40-repeat-containing domain protein n=1 Tax=Myxozyma melibiosi TaxID=54550 RepID=A0ABR1FDD7_9ASCO
MVKRKDTGDRALSKKLKPDVDLKAGKETVKEQPTKSTEHSALAPILRVITGSYEHQLLCVSLTTNSRAFAYKKPSSDESVATNFFTPIFHFASHTASIRCIASVKRYLVTGGNDEHIRLYDLQKRKEIGTLMHHEGSVTCLEFVKSGKWLISGGEDGKVLIWRTQDWEVLADMKGHKGAVNDISVHPSGKIALSVGRDRTLRLWNLMTGKNASVLKLGHDEPIQVCWNSKGDRYAVGWQKKISLFDMESKVLSTVDLTSPLYRIRFIELGDAENEEAVDYLVSSDSTGSITFRDVEAVTEDTMPVSFKLEAHTSRVKDFTFFARAPPALLKNRSDELSDKQTTFMSSVSSDGKIVIWNVNAREPIAVYETSERLNCCTLVAEEVEKYETVLQKINKADETEDEDSEDEKDEE